MDTWDPTIAHERLLASHSETDDDLDGPPTRHAIESRIAALRRAAERDGEDGMHWSAGINALKAENWERRLASLPS